MPTGLIYDVQQGKITSLHDFAMRCARQFGALIMMRDDPADAPIPERFEPRDFYRNSLAEAESKLKELRQMTEAQIEQACIDEHARLVAQQREWAEERAGYRVRYEAMLEKVKAWDPPTKDHISLKTMMVDQLNDSIRWDCYESEEPKRMRPGDWHAEQIAMTERKIGRYREEHEKELARVESRNQWLKDLRASLEDPDARS